MRKAEITHPLNDESAYPVLLLIWLSFSIYHQHISIRTISDPKL